MRGWYEEALGANDALFELEGSLIADLRIF
jgi:hypothetical protein